MAGQLGVLLLASVTGYAASDTNTWPLWLVGLTFIPLWAALLGTLFVVSRRWGTGRFRRDFGLYVRPGDVPVGLLIGAVTQLVFVWLLYYGLDRIFDTSKLDASAKELTDKANGFGIAVLVVLVALAAPFVEELFFRGFVLRAFNSRVADPLALVLSAALFAAAHFQLLQFPGLMMFGLVAGYLAQRSGRIGPSLFAHIGFNAATVIVLVADRH